MKMFFRFLMALVAAALLWLGWVVVVPVTVPHAPYKLTVGPNRTLNQVAHELEKEGVIRNRQVMVLLARLSGADRKIKAGLYLFNDSVSMLDVLKRLAEGHPDEASLTIIEGWTFHQFRQAVDKSPDLQHLARGWSDAQVMQELGVTADHPEGLFFPSTYLFTAGSSDIELYRRAYRTMQTQLDEAWAGRRGDLPYKTPYELLTMASLIEKETAREADRPMVAAVFVNRLVSGMRLQTDPAVIYGMGRSYRGNISKSDLRRDTPYNTYTRGGLTPTPISLPGKASLDAAAHPADSRALYFVARGDGSSHFSETLDQHNQAVRKYILKKER